MKKIMIFLVLISFFGNLFSQENEYKWYENDGKLFYNKNLPAYLWVSTSPNDNSKDVLMTSKASEKYTNPMYFDTEGFNTIQYANAVDTTTKKPAYPSQNAIFKVYIDGYPPVLNATFNGTRKYINGKFIYNTNLRIVLSAKDYMSGVDKIMYSLNQENFKQYSQTITFSKAGKYTLEFYAIDNTGNKSNIKKYEFTIE